MSRKLNKKVSPKNGLAAIKVVEEISPPNLAIAEDLIINDDLTIEFHYSSYIERLQKGETEIFATDATENIQLVNLVIKEPKTD